MPSFKTLAEDVLSKVADVLEEVRCYEHCTLIWKQFWIDSCDLFVLFCSPSLSLLFRLTTVMVTTSFVRAPLETHSSSSVRVRWEKSLSEVSCWIVEQNIYYEFCGCFGQQVRVTQQKSANEEPVFLSTLSRGDWFGEQALKGSVRNFEVLRL